MHRTKRNCIETWKIKTFAQHFRLEIIIQKLTATATRRRRSKKTNKHIHAKSWTCTATLHINIICSFLCLQHTHTQKTMFETKNISDNKNKQKPFKVQPYRNTQVSRCKIQLKSNKIQLNEYKKEKNGQRMECEHGLARMCGHACAHPFG